MTSVAITVREGHGYLSEVPPEAVDALRLATSYRPAGYQYTTLFKRGKSDGRVKLLKHNRFPAGLLGRVIGVLDAHGVGYDVDSETARAVRPSVDLAVEGLEDRWYQAEAVEAGLLSPRGVIRCPTGGGKTAIIAGLIAARGKPALVVVPTIDLLYQTKGFLEEHLVDEMGYAIRIGQMGDGVVDPGPSVTVATARTAANALGVAYESYEFGEYDDKDDTDVDPKALRGFFEEVGTLVVDEAHILGAQTVYDLATKVPAPNKYGFSASPWRDDGADLMIEAATGPVIYKIGTKTLVDEGWLVPPVIQVVPTRGWWRPAAWGQACVGCGAQRQRVPTDRGSRWQERCDACNSSRWRSEFQQAYAREIVENPVRNWRIAEQVKALDGPTLLLVKQVKHGRLLQQLIPGSVFLSGKDKGVDRLRAYNALRAGLTQTIVATTIADLGLDLPALRNLVLAAGGKSTTRHLQRIGRVARPCEGKRFARVIDYDDGHVHKWFADQAKDRRKIEREEWGESAAWV